MHDEPSLDITATPVTRAAAQDRVRAILREWLARLDSDAFDRIGRDAIRAAADATTRLSRFDRDPAADDVVAQIEALAASLVSPSPAPPARAWWSLRRAATLAPAPSSPVALAPLVERLDRQRDSIARRAISLETDRARLVQHDAALADAIHLIRALEPAVEAAAREIVAHDPARAARLTETAAAALPERERAVLTQVAIHRQAMLTLDLLHANQTALAGALEQARTATLAALRVATAARRATDQGTALARQTDALAQVAAAAGDETAHARRMLDDALAQARRATAAMTQTR